MFIEKLALSFFVACPLVVLVRTGDRQRRMERLRDILPLVALMLFFVLVVAD